MSARSGSGFQDDLVAERFELADVGALGTLGVAASVVEVGAEVVEASVRVGEQLPNDDQDGAADRDDRSLLAALAPTATTRRCSAPPWTPWPGSGRCPRRPRSTWTASMTAPRPPT